MSMMPTTMKRKRATLCLPHMSNISRRQFARPPHHVLATEKNTMMIRSLADLTLDIREHHLRFNALSTLMRLRTRLE